MSRIDRGRKSANGSTEIQPEVVENLKNCVAIGYFMCRFANIEYNMVAAMIKGKPDRKGRWHLVLPAERVIARNFFQLMGLSPLDLDGIFTDPDVRMGKKKPYLVETWQMLSQNRNFYLGDFAAWRKLARLLGKKIIVFEDISNGTYCEFAKICSVSPSGQIYFYKC